ncbi:hypothetical protein GCM10009096_28250 [Parasphingorhabdus litoris]|uniref:Uncharacterized protein n=1 Tax=Parasphingorhabdus litoris TaxID=394733 RepID=A0ABN1AUD0_9SPHN|nr:hypothetical protein [Parasphingorhabdus litoris]
MSLSLEYSSYQFNGNDELCLRAGAVHSKTILIIPPLFDEMNRMRRMLVDVMRLLDERAIGSILPDLPGTNESVFPQDQTSLAIWRNALNACSKTLAEPYKIASFRGGCLVDDFTDNVAKWRLSPVKGLTLLRTMMRTRIASDKEAGMATTMAQLTTEAAESQVNLAGNTIGTALFSDLENALPPSSSAVRTAQLENDTKAADIRLSGSALWLRAEPGDDLLLSGAIATDLTSWMSA